MHPFLRIVWNTCDRDIMRTHVNSKEQDGFCRGTIRKSCKLRANLSQEELGRWLRKLLAVRTRRKNLILRDYLTSRFCWFSFVHKGKVFYQRKERFSCARARSRSSLRNSHGIVTFLGGFHRHGNGYDQRRDLRVRKGGETVWREQSNKQSEKQLTHIFDCLMLLLWYTVHVLVEGRHRGLLGWKQIFGMFRSLLYLYFV